MSPSDQLSSPMDSSLSHLQRQQVTMVSLFQPSWVYKQAPLDPVHSGPPLILPRQHLLLYKSSPHHCLLPEVLVVPAKWPQVITRKPACSVPDAPSVSTQRPQVTLHKSALFLNSLQLHVAPLW